MKVFFAVSSCFIFASLFADDFSCPPTIETRQSLATAKSGWRVFADTNDANILRAVDFYDGDPKEMAQLAPDNADSGHDPVWTFSPRSGEQHTKIWQVCRYTNTEVGLAKKLREGLTKCAVKYNKTVRPQIDSITCS